MTDVPGRLRPLALLLDHAAPTDPDAVLARLPPETREALRRDGADGEPYRPGDHREFRGVDEPEDVEDVDRHPLVLGLRHGALTASDILCDIPYATGLLRTLEALDAQVGIADRPEPAELTELRDRLTELVRDDLGTEPAHWRAALAHLSADDFPGTLPQLFAAARRGPGPAYDKRPWPHEQQVSSSPFTHLLRCAEPAALSGILGALDPHDLGELAHYDIQRPLPTRLVDAFFEHAEPDCVAAFLGQHADDPRAQERVLALGDPRISAMLLRSWSLSSRVWYTVAAGPPHPAVVAALRGGPHRPGDVDPLRYAVHTRDADLIRDALRLPRGSLTTAHQITGCRRLVALGHAADLAELAHRHGPLDPLLGTLIRTTPPHHGTEGLARRLAALDREQFRHDLRHGALPAVQGQLERDEPPPWDEILAMLDEGSLPMRTRDQLAGHPDCPEEVAAALLDRDTEHTAVPLALVRRSRAYALLALARVPVVPDWMRDGDLRVSLVWSRHALDAGTLTPDDLFAHGRPAHAVLRMIDAFPRDLGALHAALAAEVRRHGADTPDAWAVVAALLDDFTGTLPELLGTAAAATAA